MPPVAWVQGDDYAGGNPPLPSYVNTAAFEAWYGATNGAGGGYGGATFRHEYEFTNGNAGKAGTDYMIDSSVQFNGHNTLKQVWSSTKAGAYHWSDLTDDGDPTETYPPNAALNQPAINGASNFPNSYWARVIFQADASITSASSTTWGTGFEIFGFQTSFNMYLINRQGKIKLDTETRQVSSVSPGIAVSQDVCDESIFFARGDSLFGDLIVYYEGNEVSDQLTVKVWAGDACSLTGVSPLVNYTVAAFDTFLSVSAIEMWNNFFSLSALGAGDRNLWVAGWKLVPGAIEANPWGVALS